MGKSTEVGFEIHLSSSNHFKSKNEHMNLSDFIINATDLFVTVIASRWRSPLKLRRHGSGAFLKKSAQEMPSGLCQLQPSPKLVIASVSPDGDISAPANSR